VTPAEVVPATAVGGEPSAGLRPWLLVAGCHRSGTSAITGALVALGLQGVDESDRIDALESNAEHWESLSVALFNESLLLGHDGTWDAPPDDGELPRQASGAEQGRLDTMLSKAYPGPEPGVLKDPRISLLLPFWRSVLGGHLAAVWIWRSPQAVALSLERRDSLPVENGLALWDHYVRSTALGLDGLPVYVLRYEDVIEEPDATLALLARWLEDQTGLSPGATPRLDEAVSSLDPGLRHQRPPADQPVPETILHTVAWLEDHGGAHDAWSARPPDAVDGHLASLISARRQLAPLVRRTNELEEEVRALQEEVRALQRERAGSAAEIARLHEALAECRRDLDAERRVTRQMIRSASWKITRPLRAAGAFRPRRPG